MVLGDLKAIGEEASKDGADYNGLFFGGLLVIWLIVLSARGAHAHRKEMWHYDESGEPHWPGGER